MKALRVHNLGEPKDVLKLEEVPVPEPAPGQIVVRVLATAVNFPDALMCRGLYQEKPPLPFTPGVELCGEVVALGEGVTTSPRRPRHRLPVLPGIVRGYAPMDISRVFPAPPSLSDTEAAALFIGYQTGWFALHRRAGLQAGETVLVHAAAGGVGSAAVQLAKAAGARVIVVVGGAAKAEYARKTGRRHRRRPVCRRLRVRGQGSHRRARCRRHLRPGGRRVLHALHQVHRLRRTHPHHRLRQRDDPHPWPQPRPCQELLAARPALGPLQQAEPRTRGPLPRRTHRPRGRCDQTRRQQVLSLEELPDGVQRLADGTTVGRLVATPHGAQ